MKVEVFALCDAATDSYGKLNILGAFDVINSRKVPVVHPQCSIASRMRFDRIERGEHTLRVNIVDEDGKAVVPALEAKLQINFPDQLPSQIFNIILNMQGLKFEKFGTFSIDLALDNRQEASLPLFVREIADQQGGGGGGQPQRWRV